VVFDKIIVEMKAVDQITTPNLRQAIDYLASSGHELCLLVNFGGERVEIKRVAL
jgi:GxxExxY protein